MPSCFSPHCPFSRPSFSLFHFAFLRQLCLVNDVVRNVSRIVFRGLGVIQFFTFQKTKQCFKLFYFKKFKKINKCHNAIHRVYKVHLGFARQWLAIVRGVDKSSGDDKTSRHQPRERRVEEPRRTWRWRRRRRSPLAGNSRSEWPVAAQKQHAPCQEDASRGSSSASDGEKRQ